ncbi:MAG: amidohydrolase family protein [Sedimenticola sp.]
MWVRDTVKIFDAHLHIIDSRFPLVPNQGYLPEPFTCDDYLVRTGRYELVGGAVVSGSFQAFDQTYLIDALERLGPSFVGVTQLPESVTDQQLLELDAVGVRALRFNLKRGGSENVRLLEQMAKRVHEVVGWHVELYVDSRELQAYRKLLTSLPRVSIDHLGLSKDGLAILLRLVEQGVHVKATGFGRVDFDVKAALRDLHGANPNALMFGTDLPSTRAPRPYRDDDLSLVVDALGEDQADRVLYGNALAFYRPDGEDR